VPFFQKPPCSGWGGGPEKRGGVLFQPGRGSSGRNTLLNPKRGLERGEGTKRGKIEKGKKKKREEK